MNILSKADALSTVVMIINGEEMEKGCQTRRMFGHDYAIPGTYEVTMVVAGRRPVFG